MPEKEGLGVRNIDLDYSVRSCITLIYCRDHERNVIVFAASDCELGHYGLFNLAQDPDLALDEDDIVLSEKAEILGGALLNYNTLEKIRDSHAFGPVDDGVLDKFVDKLEAKRMRLASKKKRDNS